MGQPPGPITWFSLSLQLVQRDHPTPWEGFHAFLATQSTWKYDQVLRCLPQYLHLVGLVGCQPKSGQLLYPGLQDFFGVGIVVGYVEGTLHDSHGLWHLIHLIIILCLEGCNLRLTTQSHRLGTSVWDDPVYHVHAWECRASSCNTVQVRLVNVHIHLAVYEIFPKSSCKCFVELFPFQLDVLA